MELKEVMLKRRSVRKFTSEVVSDEQINTLLHYAMSGPSACNKQPWEFYVVTNPDKLKELREFAKYNNIESPLNIIVCGNLDRCLPGKVAEFWVQDCSAAIENILLGVTDLGLGAVWCGVYPDMDVVNKVKDILEIKENFIPLGIVRIGYPDCNTNPGDWYKEEYVHYIK